MSHLEEGGKHREVNERKAKGSTPRTVTLTVTKKRIRCVIPSKKGELAPTGNFFEANTANSGKHGPRILLVQKGGMECTDDRQSSKKTP